MNLQDAASIASVVAAVSAAVAAIASWCSAVATRKTSRGQLVLQLLTEYGTEEMRLAVTGLADLVQMLRTSETRERPKEDSIDGWRRRFSQYCLKVYKLQRLGLIDRRSVCVVTPKDVAETYLSIEKLESQKRTNYDQSSFKFFAEFYRLPRETNV